jgi:photosynthetic reaction center cytochrome c subunit
MRVRLGRVFVTGIIALSAVNAALVLAQSGQGPQMSDQVFKDVQVLKGIPVDEFMGTMGIFTSALSMCCADCHVGAGTNSPHWEADTPRKRTARRMVQMVAALNRDSFNGRQVVTCWTCHRGGSRPAVTAALDTVYGSPLLEPPDVLPQGSQVPSPDEIFGKYIEALGGTSRLATLTSYLAKGKSTAFGEMGSGSPVDIYAKAPNQRATFVHTSNDGDLARTFDGRAGFVINPLTVVGEMPLTATELDGARLDAELSFPGRIKEVLSNWRVSNPTTLNGREVQVVQGSDATGLIATFYFDKESGLLARLVRYSSSVIGRVPTQVDYSDYRNVGEIKMPFHWVFSWLSGQDDFVLTEIEPNVAIEAAKFTPQAARPRIR